MREPTEEFLNAIIRSPNIPDFLWKLLSHVLAPWFICTIPSGSSSKYKFSYLFLYIPFNVNSESLVLYHLSAWWYRVSFKHRSRSVCSPWEPGTENVLNRSHGVQEEEHGNKGPISQAEKGRQHKGPAERASEWNTCLAKTWSTNPSWGEPLLSFDGLSTSYKCFSCVPTQHNSFFRNWWLCF